MMSYIYSLNDPVTGEIRYIGHTVNPKRRLQKHVTPSEILPDTYKNRWLRELRKDGLKPIMEIIEDVNHSNWEEREIFWISFYRNLGSRLTNTTDGGKGVSISNPEIIEKIKRLAREATLGIKRPEEFRERIRISSTGRRHSKETLQKMRQNTKKWWDSISSSEKDCRIKIMREKLTKEVIKKSHRVELLTLPGRGKIKYRGVSESCNGTVFPYRARITYKGKELQLGTFPSPEDAAIARDVKAIELYGSYTYLNFPDNPIVQEALNNYAL